MTMNAEKISKLHKGGRVVLSNSNGITVAAERSGDGRTIAIVRETPEGFTVIRRERY